MTTNTPGPWHVANSVQIRSARHQIAKVWMMRNGEGNANANLLAAAPDLLEVLKTIAEMNPYDTSSMEYVVSLAKGAVKKVIGDSV